MPNSARISYTEFRNQLGEITSRPILTADLIHQATTQRVAGLLDSGADINVMPYGVGKALGLDWGEQRFDLRVSGNLANYDTRLVAVEIKVADFVPVALVFAWTQAERVPLIFGQTNFFQAFNVCFFRSESYFTLTSRAIS